MSAIPSYSIYDFSITMSLQPQPWVRYPLSKEGPAACDGGNTQVSPDLKMACLKQGVQRQTEQVKSLQGLSESATSVQEAQDLLSRTALMVLEQTLRAFLTQANIEPDDAAGVLWPAVRV